MTELIVRGRHECVLLVFGVLGRVERDAAGEPRHPAVGVDARDDRGEVIRPERPRVAGGDVAVPLRGDIRRRQEDILVEPVRLPEVHPGRHSAAVEQPAALQHVHVQPRPAAPSAAAQGRTSHAGGEIHGFTSRLLIVNGDEKGIASATASRSVPSGAAAALSAFRPCGKARPTTVSQLHLGYPGIVRILPPFKSMSGDPVVNHCFGFATGGRITAPPFPSPRSPSGSPVRRGLKVGLKLCPPKLIHQKSRIRT